MSRSIGVVVAVELGAVLERYGTPTETAQFNGFTVRSYIRDGIEMHVVDSGAGEIAAAASTQMLIDRFNVDMILNFGVVGALTEQMRTAELCVVESVIHHQFHTDGWLDLPRGLYPGRDTPYFYPDKELIARAIAVEPSLQKVVCASGDKFVDLEEDKRELAKNCKADICEMEAAGIVITCERNKVPCLLLKAISDSLIGGGKEFFEELERVSAICFEVADRVMQNFAQE